MVLHGLARQAWRKLIGRSRETTSENDSKGNDSSTINDHSVNP